MWAMFTEEDRNQIRARLLERASEDSCLTSAALTGSASRGAEDRWSDIDLFFGVAAEIAVAIPAHESHLSLALVPRNAGDVHVYRHWRCSVAISAAGGLEALEFVQCFVEATLYGGLASRELRGYALLYIRDLFLG
jgi:hypothetical protein